MIVALGILSVLNTLLLCGILLLLWQIRDAVVTKSEAEKKKPKIRPDIVP